ncbi:small integral membrane protein 8 [Lycorma delicatula]|uniref:small integral membrane protein 8 n=1 Tax=Lycorma delicatula TaxID=130591 RepID=UPI003F50F8DE
MKKSKPGDGIKSLRTSTAFRVLNFELYSTPNKMIMAAGLLTMGLCSGYIFYMRKKYEGMGYYSAVSENGNELYLPKKSKWDN